MQICFSSEPIDATSCSYISCAGRGVGSGTIKFHRISRGLKYVKCCRLGRNDVDISSNAM